MSRWKEFRREPVAGNGPGSKNRAITGSVAPVVLGVPPVPGALGDALHGRRRGCRETTYHKQLRQRIERQLGFPLGLEYYQVGRKKGMASSISSGPGGCRMGTRNGSGSPRNGSRPNGKPSMGLRWSWIKAYQPSHRSPTVSAAMSSQPICPGSMWLREYVLVLEAVAWLSHQPVLGRDAAPMVHQECLSADSG